VQLRVLFRSLAAPCGRLRSAGRPYHSRMSDQLIPADYASWLADLKSRIQRSRTQAALAVNQELMRLYHHIGSEILARQSRQGWGAKVMTAWRRPACGLPGHEGPVCLQPQVYEYFAELCPSLQIGPATC